MGINGGSWPRLGHWHGDIWERINTTGCDEIEVNAVMDGFGKVYHYKNLLEKEHRRM